MAIWERYQGEFALTNVDTHGEFELFENNEDTDNFQNADVVAVDGILTIHTDTDDLCGFRLLVMPVPTTQASVDEDYPRPDDPMVWYSFYAARGPLVFRMRSKKTVQPNYRMLTQCWKASGGTATNIRFGLQILWVLKR